MRHYLFFIFIFFCSVSFSQSIRNFTADPVKFPEEMETFLTETNKKQGEKIMGQFHEIWIPGKFSPSQQDAIYHTANAMLRKRMKAFPDFANYLTTLISYANSNQPTARFDLWQASLDKLLLMSTKSFAKYVDVCNDLFLSNSLYVSPAVRWYSDSPDYTFEFDSLPRVVFTRMTLTGVSKGDSSIIFNTQGVYYPNREIFYGKGGEINWKRAGWDVNVVNARLSDYSIDVSKSEYKADSVEFTNTTFFNKPLLGRVTDKILANVTAENASYPRFESYQVEFNIKNIVPDVDFKGGFTMVGNRMIGSGNKEDDAHLYIYRNKVPFLVAGSQAFVIRKDKITADHASVTFHYEKDSIYHPSVSFKYIVKDRELALIRGEDGKSKSPYFDSYHNLDMYFDGLYWKIDDPVIDMKMISGAGESKAGFESSNYFRKNRFDKLQGMNDLHPLYTIKKYAETNQSRVIYTEELAKSMRMSPSEVRSLLISLSYQGFVTYDSDNDRVVVKDRVYYYLLAYTGKTDYDVIQFESTIKSKANASINLLNFEITMRGVAPFILSDSQNVVIYPQEQEIRVKKNRDLTFAGRVKAGRFDFYGKEFSFDYANFKINLENVDSVRIKVEDDAGLDEYGRKKLISVKSVLEKISGDLLIDKEGNKSGLVDNPQYPILNSKKDSYVYYDKPSIQDGVYEKDKFYFHLDPFTIDSLDNFSRSRLRFDGELVSAGIFPDFRDTLRLRPDLSLGLARTTGEGGWPAYGGKGTFTNNIDLSNNGLLGDGKIDYITSTTKSDRFIFFPDSTNAYSNSFTNRKETFKGVEFPNVKAGFTFVHWMPKQDAMYVYKKEEPISMYEKQAMLAGDLQLRPSGMTGNGIMSFAASELEANLFKYKSNDFHADTSDFRLTTDDINAQAFAANNVQSTIDFTKRLGEFKSNGGGSYVKFPLNQYICYIDKFTWYMDDKEIEMSASSSGNKSIADSALTGVNLSGSEFISVEPTQDSLRFKAPYAKYSLKDYLIKADQVALIQTADASVIPDSGKVVIERYAKIQTLKNSRIVANNTTKYHTIYNASVDILGRKKYEGSGDYDYIDENKTKQHFHFENVRVDSTYQTIADAELTDSAGFPLSPMFSFKGNVHLIASKKPLTFTGFAKPNFRCDSVPQNWLRFSNEIDPDNVMIPIESPISDNGVKLSSGIIQSNDLKNIYATFLNPKNKPADSSIIDVKGFLTFNKEANEFRIASMDKLNKSTVPGNYISLNDSKCTVYAEGKLNFGTDLGQITMQTVGNTIYNWNNDSTSFRIMLALNFFFNDEALKSMSDYFAQNGTLSPTKDNDSPFYAKGLAELIGKEKSEKLITEMNLYGSFKKIPDELRYTLFFTDVQMKWDNLSHSFKSTGPIGIGNMEKTSVNKYVNGSIEIIHKRAGDAITVYLEPENQIWFYFSYTRGLMQAISSQSVFNEAINKVKPDKRVNKAKDKLTFEYMLSTDRAVKTFLRKFNATQQEEEPKKEEEK